MDAFWVWLWGTGWFWFGMFWVALLVNGRAAFKLLLDWKGMLTTCRFVEHAYERLAALPDEAALERDLAAPVFVHLVPAWQEPEIATTLRALLDSRYPHAKLHVVVATREDEERSPHPAMGVSTAELVRRFREALPPWQQKMLSLVAMPGEGRKARQLNWALRPEVLKPLLDLRYDPARVWIGLSDADSIPDPNVYRWIAADLANCRGQRAYQGVTLSLANFDRLDVRGRVCAVQQSSIFIRVSIARLINERRRIEAFARLQARAPRVARLLRPVFELCLRRSQICLGHNQFVRLDVLQNLGRIPDVRRDGRLDPGLRAGRARRPDGRDADAGAGRHARDERRHGSAECALVQGRARRRRVSPRRLAREADRVQFRSARPARRQQGDRVADRRRRLSRARLPRLAPRVPVFVSPRVVRARRRVSRRSHSGSPSGWAAS